MNNFLGEAELFWKNYLAKQLHQQLHYAWQREMRERAGISYFFQLHPTSFPYERERKIVLPMKLF